MSISLERASVALAVDECEGRDRNFGWARSRRLRWESRERESGGPPTATLQFPAGRRERSGGQLGGQPTARNYSLPNKSAMGSPAIVSLAMQPSHWVASSRGVDAQLDPRSVETRTG